MEDYYSRALDHSSFSWDQYLCIKIHVFRIVDVQTIHEFGVLTVLLCGFEATDYIFFMIYLFCLCPLNEFCKTETVVKMALFQNM